MVLAVSDLVEVASGYHAVGLGLGDRGIVTRALELVVLLDQQPVGFFLVGCLAAHANQGPFALQLVAMQDELQRASTQRRVHVRADRLRLPRSLVPHHDGAAAILALGNDAFEPAVFHGMVFHLHGEPLVCHDVARALGDGPALEHAVPSQPKIVVKMRGGVLLNNKRKRLLLRFRCGFLGGCLPAGFSGDLEVAHLAITRELAIDGV